MSNILTMLQSLTANEVAGNKSVFDERYVNGKEVSNLIKGFKSFYDKGQEVLIYTDKGTYAANKLEIFDSIFLETVYNANGCIYKIESDYDALYDYAEKLHNSK